MLCLRHCGVWGSSNPWPSPIQAGICGADCLPWPWPGATYVTCAVPHCYAGSTFWRSPLLLHPCSYQAPRMAYHLLFNFFWDSRQDCHWWFVEKGQRDSWKCTGNKLVNISELFCHVHHSNWAEWDKGGVHQSVCKEPAWPSGTGWGQRGDNIGKQTGFVIYHQTTKLRVSRATQKGKELFQWPAGSWAENIQLQLSVCWGSCWRRDLWLGGG